MFICQLNERVWIYICLKSSLPRTVRRFRNKLGIVCETWNLPDFSFSRCCLPLWIVEDSNCFINRRDNDDEKIDLSARLTLIFQTLWQHQLEFSPSTERFFFHFHNSTFFYSHLARKIVKNVLLLFRQTHKCLDLLRTVATLLFSHFPSELNWSGGQIQFEFDSISFSDWWLKWHGRDKGQQGQRKRVAKIFDGGKFVHFRSSESSLHPNQINTLPQCSVCIRVGKDEFTKSQFRVSE